MKRVVITGMGIYSPIGNSINSVKNSLLDKHSGVRYMSDWENYADLKTRVGGVVDGIEPMSIKRKYRRTMGRISIIAALAARDALIDAGIEDDAVLLQSERVGVSVGTIMGSTEAFHDFFRDVFKYNGFTGQQTSVFIKFMGHTASANISLMYKIKGRVMAPTAACASGSQAIGLAYETIQQGIQDIMVAGGAEELHYTTGGVFDIFGAATKNYNNDVHKTPRPFDARRDGIVVGEGAGIIILEELEHAKARGAKIYAEIIGFSSLADGEGVTAPAESGLVSCMNTSLKTAGLKPDEIDYINAHATATIVGDVVEANAIYSVFSDRVPVSSTKGYMGHTLGASGGIETILCTIMLNNDFLAPNLNFESKDPNAKDINIITDIVKNKNIEFIMNNNFAFGGINNSLIIKRYA